MQHWLKSYQKGQVKLGEMVERRMRPNGSTRDRTDPTEIDDQRGTWILGSSSPAIAKMAPVYRFHLVHRVLCSHRPSQAWVEPWGGAADHQSREAMASLTALQKQNLLDFARALANGAIMAGYDTHTRTRTLGW